MVRFSHKNPVVFYYTAFRGVCSIVIPTGGWYGVIVPAATYHNMLGIEYNILLYLLYFTLFLTETFNLIYLNYFK